MNYWEIRTFSKIKVPIRTKKLELVPIKTCPKIKDPCRHSAIIKQTTTPPPHHPPLNFSKVEIWDSSDCSDFQRFMTLTFQMCICTAQNFYILLLKLLPLIRVSTGVLNFRASLYRDQFQFSGPC